ncbi:MAG: xanthine dehydrogenase family protein subunit M [Candidatus Thermoplasmatota archaeon]|nr:xanthine dehydrogenase family protein subunit M [Candidatus Thermoplasmatota archaeon]
MTPNSFEFHAPRSLNEAISLAARLGEDAKFLAGGQSLIPLMKLRFASFPSIIDLSHIKELKYIRSEADGLKIGAMTTTAEIEKSAEVKKRFGALHDAVSHIADPLVRNMGTVGGNVCHADPGNDLPAVTIALNAEFSIAGNGVTRVVRAADFFIDTFTTSIRPGEILKEIILPFETGKHGSAYIKQKRRAGDYSVAGVACSVILDDDGKCVRSGVAMTSVGPKAVRASETEAFLVGKTIDGKISDEAGKIASREAMPADDFYGTADFKRKVVGLLCSDALRLSVSRAKGGI